MKKSLFALALGLAMSYGAVATAAPFQQDERYDHADRDHGHDQDHDRRDADHDRDHDRRDNVIVHDRGMHEGWYHRGGYVPVEYRDRRYVVDDWRAYRLAPPPPGHQWVRSDNGEFLLVAISTGIIVNIALGGH
ncbi:RcnB family protein [Dyella sp. ASV21]|jgi:Ni/Co efflux regulator RcnB|uniref:RcnB family protein n=1 Tax=Dyella sp. ASV21 TaxID=2795114 RepID=UPI0018EB1CF6|nr:RcnB family protein [Dyella sp. ASV21]